MSEQHVNPLEREEVDEARHALALATAWLSVMDDVMPVTEDQCTRIASEFVRLKAMSDADVEATARDRESCGTQFDLGEVEAVARAICLSNRDQPDREWLLADGRRDITGWQIYEGDAKAAIAAMREHRRETAR